MVKTTVMLIKIIHKGERVSSLVLNTFSGMYLYASYVLLSI